jgi:Mn2+/Fe2+ NRAMP family transporter
MIEKVKKLGPGLLFAGAAIGVSHLVQSTRAGADFGFGLLWALLLSNIFKYPFFFIWPKIFNCDR